MAGQARSHDHRLGIAIFITTFSLFLLSSGRERPWGDANVQYMPAQSLLRDGSVTISKPWPDDQPPGRNGKHYSTYPVLTLVVQLPGLLVLGAISAIAPAARRFAEPLTSHLACSFFGALTCLLFFRLVRRLGVAPRAASLATLLLSLATTVWVYAHYSYSEIIQAAMFLGFLGALLRAAEEPGVKSGRWLGLWAGLLFAVKYLFIASLIGGAAFLLLALRRRRPALLPLVGHGALTFAPFVLASMFYNWLCWGSPFSTGYDAYFKQYWGENLFVGLWGMFLAPGKSVFLYSPPLILGFAALPMVWHKHRAFVVAAALTVLPVLLVYAYYKLNGDYAWGPRFVVFAVPVLMVPVAVLLDAWERSGWTWLRRGAVAAVLALGIAVQLIGNALYWDHFIRISIDARHAWLGTPNRKGAVIPVRADGHCDSCFEDVHQLQWLPPFQPIWGHVWLLRSLAAGKDWRAAEADAPWHVYTRVPIDIKDTYARARLDWWGMLWIADFPAYRGVGVVLLLVFAGGTAAGAWRWRRAHRLARDADPAPQA